MEKTQRCFTKTIHKLKDLTHFQRLRKLGALTLANRRTFADMLTVYRCLHGDFNCSPSDLDLSLVTSCTRRYSLRLRRQPVRGSIFAPLFCHIAAAIWNRLPTSVVTCTSLRAFKLKLYNHLFDI